MVLNSLPISVVCWLPLQTVWTHIKPDKTSELIWIQTVWHADGIPEIIFWKSRFSSKSTDDKRQAKLPSRQRVKFPSDIKRILHECSSCCRYRGSYMSAPLVADIGDLRGSYMSAPLVADIGDLRGSYMSAPLVADIGDLRGSYMSAPLVADIGDLRGSYMSAPLVADIEDLTWVLLLLQI